MAILLFEVSETTCHHNQSVNSNDYPIVGIPKPTILSYCASFLKPEMLHVYRQVIGVRAFRNLVVTRRRENATRFPYQNLLVLKKNPLRWLHRAFHQMRGGRIPVSGYETIQISRIIDREAVSLVHVYFGTEAARLLSWLPDATVPVIVSFHGADVSEAISNSELEKVCSAATLVLHRSDSLRSALLSRGVPPSKLRANPTGVPVPEEMTPRTFSRAKPLRLLQACRFIEKKGLDISMEAVKKLIDRGIDVQLTLAGDGPQRAELEALAVRFGIASRVRWTGFIAPEALCEEYRQNDIFLHPSRETGTGDREGIPNSLLEAMAHGRVVVASKHSGIPEVIENGINGWLVDHADPSLLADAVLNAIADPSSAISMASAARKTVIDRFSTESCIKQLEICYQEAMGNRSND